MTNKNDTQKILHEYLKHCYDSQSDHFLIVHDGVEKTVTEWCEYFGGVPDGVSNHNFLMEMLNEKV